MPMCVLLSIVDADAFGGNVVDYDIETLAVNFYIKKINRD